MRLFRNEKGGTLVYVLFVFALLCVLIPVILTTSSHTTLQLVTNRNEKLATTLANSALETFIAYLDQVPANQEDRVAYFKNYPGKQENLTYTLPEGVPVVYSLTYPAENSVQAKVAVGTGAARREHAVRYTFQVQNGGGGGGRTPVPEEPNQILYGNAVVEKKNTNVTTTYVSGLKTKIKNVLDAETKKLQDYAQFYMNQAPACVPFNRIAGTIANGTADPVLVVPVCEQVEIANDTFVWGSEDKPVVMIFESLTVKNGNGITATIHGDLIVKGNLNLQNHSTFRINSTQTAQVMNGNLIVGGKLSAQNGFRLNTADKPLRSLYAGEMDLQNSSEVYAGRIVVSGLWHMQNGGTYVVDTDMMAGTMTLKNGTTLTAVQGDILVRDNLTVGNGGTYTAGGVMATGVDLSLGNHLTVDTGGGTSILDGTGDSGGSASPPPWNPVRN